MDETELSCIEGTVQAVVFQNPENGYTVLKLRSGDETVTCVGNLPGVAAGEGLRLYGSWTSHASYGQQFKAEHAERSLPRAAPPYTTIWPPGPSGASASSWPGSSSRNSGPEAWRSSKTPRRSWRRSRGSP